MKQIPSIAVCQVTAHDPPFGVRVIFRAAGQGTSFSVKMGYEYADALRVKQQPLPGIGTWGIVAIPNGDLRSAIWLKSYYPSKLDALTSDGTAGAPFIYNDAHWSGHWSYLNASGYMVEQWADGSFFIGASGTALPTVSRHTVDSSGNQKAISFIRGDRIPNPPSPFAFEFNHATGSSILVDVSGNVSVSGAAGTTLTLSFGNTSLKIDSSGHAFLNLTGSETLDISQGGSPASDFLTLVSKLVTVFNGHEHTGVTAGGANTGTVVSPINSGSISSASVKTSG